MFDFSASPVANTRIQTWSGFTGLDVSFTTLVRLAAPASSVSITMVHFATAPTVDLGYEEVDATDAGVERRKEYWRWLLVAMLGMLAVEWWLYAKRVA